MTETKIISPQLVVIESPFKGNDWSETRRNILYVKLCASDCLRRGEVPWASHIFYTQTGILDDSIPEERQRGIDAGVAWGKKADLRAVYEDFGISKGMEYGIKAAEEIGQRVEYRSLKESMDLEKRLKQLDQAPQFINVGGLLF
jgi:hypothetical protein